MYQDIDRTSYETTAVCKDNFSYPTLTIWKTYRAKFDDWVWLFNWDNDLFRDYPVENFELAMPELAGLIKDKEELEAEIAELEDEHDELRRKSSDLEDEIEDHKSDKSAAEEAIEDYNSLIAEDPEEEDQQYLEGKIKDIKDLEKVIDEKQEKLDDYEEEMDELDNSISEKEWELDEIKEMINKVL